MLSHKTIKRLRFGGPRDTVTGTALLSGALATNPFFTAWLDKLLDADFLDWEAVQAKRLCAHALGVKNLLCSKAANLSQSDVDQMVFLFQGMLGMSISAVAGGFWPCVLQIQFSRPHSSNSELSLRSSAVPGSLLLRACRARCAPAFREDRPGKG